MKEPITTEEKKEIMEILELSIKISNETDRFCYFRHSPHVNCVDVYIPNEEEDEDTYKPAFYKHENGLEELKTLKKNLKRYLIKHS